MFIELTSVYYDSNYHTHNKCRLFINVSDIVSVIDENNYIGTYWCRRIILNNGETYYVTESYNYILDKMSAIVNLMYKEGDSNDWK